MFETSDKTEYRMTTQVPKRFIVFTITSLFLLLSANALATSSIDETCKSKYPIVLSHHWGVRKCAPDCPHDASDNDELPPRISNHQDASLTRPNMGDYYRYYSREIVDKLEKECGNDVYIADKPAYSTYKIRATSMRGTVMQALEETGAEKVILIGMSQGVQDARYLAANLPVDDDDPSKGMMNNKVAAIVSVVGEDQGAESSSILLTGVYLLCGWEKMGCSVTWAGENDLTIESFWQRDNQYVLNEFGEPIDDWLARQQASGDAPAEWTIENIIYKSYLASLTNLSRRYMLGDGYHGWDWDWNNLVRSVSPIDASNPSAVCDESTHLWCVDDSFGEKQVQSEKNNGVQYYSYSAKIRNWTDEFDDPEGHLTWLAIYAIWGQGGDAYVSLDSQSFESKEHWGNFKHVKTLDGKWLSRGYHHMFFSGRYDHKLAPPDPSNREPAPYNGGSDDFYAQVIRNLVNEGF